MVDETRSAAPCATRKGDHARRPKKDDGMGGRCGAVGDVGTAKWGEEKRDGDAPTASTEHESVFSGWG